MKASQTFNCFSFIKWIHSAQRIKQMKAYAIICIYLDELETNRSFLLISDGKFIRKTNSEIKMSNLNPLHIIICKLFIQ